MREKNTNNQKLGYNHCKFFNGAQNKSKDEIHGFTLSQLEK